MSGEELIAWAVAKCEKEGLPPHDANILMFIRGEHNLPTKRGE